MCHPGMMEVAKSKDTIVCTESTNGVDNPARTKETNSKRFQCLTLPVHPKEKKFNTNHLNLSLDLSLKVAKSGTSPVYQKTIDTVKYVEIANTSHNKGELKFGQRGPKSLGSGRVIPAFQTLGCGDQARHDPL